MGKAARRISSLGTIGTFARGRACGDTLFHVLNEAFDGPPLGIEERAVMPMAGGIMQHGYQCGMVWGASLAAGAHAFRRFGADGQGQVRAIAASRRVVESFQIQNKHVNCLEITEIDKTSTTMQMVTYFLLKGGTINCFRMAARYAPVAYRAIDAAFEIQHTEPPPLPLCCSGLLAHKLGLSDMHVVMASGLSGGIGLTGGACGALGAAIWSLAMKTLKEGANKVDFKAPKALDLIDRFLKATDYEFDCPKIAGRRFDGVHDHAAFVRDGGCASVLDALAAG